MTWWTKLWHRHAFVLRMERGRLYLHCVTCGHDTPGWSGV